MTKHPHFDNDPVDSLECGDRLGYSVRIIGLNRTFNPTRMGKAVKVNVKEDIAILLV